MSVSADYLAYVIDQLQPFARVVSRRMFGGAGLYADDLFFGLIDDDTLYFKVDDSNRGDYVARGCPQFQPFPDNPRKMSMNYYRVPAEVLEEPEELIVWARKARQVAAKAAAATSGKRSPAKSAAAPRRKQTPHKKSR